MVSLLPHVGKLLAQERNHGIGGGVALLRRLPGACREEGREGSVKFGGIDLPSAIVVAGGADLSSLDVPEHGAFVYAGGGGGSCKVIQGGCSLLLRALQRGCTCVVKGLLAPSVRATDSQHDEDRGQTPRPAVNRGGPRSPHFLSQAAQIKAAAASAANTAANRYAFARRP